MDDKCDKYGIDLNGFICESDINDKVDEIVNDTHSKIVGGFIDGFELDELRLIQKALRHKVNSLNGDACGYGLRFKYLLEVVTDAIIKKTLHYK